jgi:hypothetical protein
VTERPAGEWPKHLKQAKEILIRRLALPDDRAELIVVTSFAAALECAVAINSRCRNADDISRRLRLQSVFARIAKCLRRSPAALRSRANSELKPVLQDVIDAETMHAFIETLIKGFACFPNQPTSLTVLRAISEPKVADGVLQDWSNDWPDGTDLLKQEYDSLGAVDQRSIESGLTSFSAQDADLHAADACDVIANVLARNLPPITTSMHDLLTDYVAFVAKTWRQHGIKPGRARNPCDPGYHGTFHHFVELVLTAAVDPWTKRHDGEALKTASDAPRQSDTAWLISDDHVRSALS